MRSGHPEPQYFNHLDPLARGGGVDDHERRYHKPHPTKNYNNQGKGSHGIHKSVKGRDEIPLTLLTIAVSLASFLTQRSKSLIVKLSSQEKCEINTTWKQSWEEMFCRLILQNKLEEINHSRTQLRGERSCYIDHFTFTRKQSLRSTD